VIARFLLAGNWACAVYNAGNCIAAAWQENVAMTIIFAIGGSLNYTVAKALKRDIESGYHDE
jgi:hypothetical protein